MSAKELTRDQLVSLKQNYLMEKNGSVSYGELANADALVSDATIFRHYAGTSFSPDDFN